MHTSSALDAFFQPRSIAVVGASADLAKMASRPIAYLRRHGFQGRVFAVNPKYGDIGGTPCVPSIESLPDDVDLALISLPAAQIPDAVRRCGAKGIRVATILSGGFGELGTPEGRQLEAELRDAIRSSGMRICGPNCQGGVNLFDRVAATYSGALSSDSLAAGPIALVTQSGVFGGLVFAAAQEEGIGVGFWTSTGNELDLRFSDFLDHVVDDPRIRVIGGYLESVKDEGPRFVQSLRRARAAGKPVVLLKTGPPRPSARPRPPTRPRSPAPMKATPPPSGAVARCGCIRPMRSATSSRRSPPAACPAAAASACCRSRAAPRP